MNITNSKVARIIWLYAIPLMAGVLGLIGAAPEAHACDPGSYYDPTHQICQASPPAYPPPGYGPPRVNHNPPLPPNSQLYPH